VKLFRLKSSFIVSDTTAAIAAHPTNRARPYPGAIKAHYRVPSAKKNPKAYADIKINPVTTVSSYGKLS
jgi:hypothetical protein